MNSLKLFFSFSLVFLLLFGIYLYAFGQDKESKSPTNSSETITYEDVKTIFENSCLRCHKKGKKAEWSPLTTYKEIVEGTAVKDKDCEDTQYKKYVVPGKPMESLLYLKLLERPPCGKRMPRRPVKELGEDEIKMIYQWIEQGALEKKTSFK